MGSVYSFFTRWQKHLRLGVSLYVVLLALSHSTLPSIHIWLIAAFFSIAMNCVYVTEAYWRGQYFGIELSVACVLIVMSVLGVVLSPVYVIAAIIAHGLWDVAKHFGAGVPFFSWYIFGCFFVDVIYGAALAVYWWTA